MADMQNFIISPRIMAQSPMLEMLLMSTSLFKLNKHDKYQKKYLSSLSNAAICVLQISINNML